VLYTSDAREDLDSLVDALATVGDEGGHCMCLGTVAFDLEGVGVVTLHHGETVRWKDVFGNVELASPDRMMAWLSARGMHFVREEYDAAQARGKANRVTADGWQAAMPASLRPFFDDMRRTGNSEDPAWTAAIEQEYPDPVERARVLLALYARTEESWFRYPSWEAVPAALLSMLPTATVEAAVTDDATTLGMLRLLCSHEFRKHCAKLSPKLRAALRAAVGRAPAPARPKLERALS
jgi:hypothetical protein